MNKQPPIAKETDPISSPKNVVAQQGKQNQTIEATVDQLFDFILGDNALHPDLQANMLRLKAPVIMVAMEDGAVLNHTNHPVRMLLFLMARVGKRWSPDMGKDPRSLFGKIDETITQIINTNDVTTYTFTKAFESFFEYCEQEEKRIQLIEERLKQTKEGLQKSETMKAKINLDIMSLIEKVILPESILQFIHEQWAPYLLWIALNEGVNHSNYIEAKKVLKELILQLESRSKIRLSHEEKKLANSLVAKIEQGLQNMGLTAGEIRYWLNIIDSVQQKGVVTIKEELLTLETPKKQNLKED